MLPRSVLRLPRPRSLILSSTQSLRASPSAFRYSTTTTEHKDAHHASGGDHHDDHHSHYDPPGGWLWGIRPGEKYEKEGWENLFYFGFIGSWVIAIAAYTMKEDTSIQTWALEEARRRLEKEGILEDTSK